MADLYVSDGVYEQYVMEHGDEAKAAMREVLDDAAPGGSDE